MIALNYLCADFKKACDDESICYSMATGRFYLTKDGKTIHIVSNCPFCGEKIRHHE